MKPPHQHSRINLHELKAQLVKKLGSEGSKQYFYYLHGFLSLKLSKPEFNKLCLRILGHENIPLHNHFIRSILRNACSAKAPPPIANHHKGDNDISKQVIHGKEILSNGYQQNGSQISTTQPLSGLPGLPNGDNKLRLPISPRKARTTGLRDRRGGERRSSLGPNGKVAPAPPRPHDASARLDGVNTVLENGYSKLNPPDNNTDITKPPLVQRNQVMVQQAESENTGPTTVYSKDRAELVPINDEKRDVSAARRSPIRAPLGIPLCAASIGGSREAVSRDHVLAGSFSDDALVESCALRERMESIASGQGLESVSVECADVLNHGLNSYLKGLIKSCIDIVGARSGVQLTKDSSPSKDQAHIKLLNGVKPGHQFRSQNREQKTNCPISLQDFRVAMELNPRQLGEDWPLLLEKICTHAFEE